MHHLVRHTYAARVIAYLFCAALLAVDANWPGCTFAFTYPHLLAWLQQRYANTASSARRFLILDGLLAGVINALLGFSVIVCVALLSALIISARLIAPVVIVIQVVMAYLLSVTAMALWFDAALPGMPDAQVLLAMLMIVGYGGVVSFLGFGETTHLAGARREALARNESSAALARRMAPFLPRIPSAETVAGDVRRRPVTVVFTDLVGFTALMDAGPEDRVVNALNAYLDKVVTVAGRHGGQVDKFMGDGVMLLFGLRANQSRQAAACCAVACAMDIGQLMVPLTCEFQLPFAVRTGIHSGFAAVGYFGSGARMEETAIGRTVNIAARLEQAARPGRILVSRETADMIDHQFALVAVKPLNLKGISQPVAAFEVDVKKGGVDEKSTNDRADLLA